MYRVASTGWIFVVSKKTGRGYDVAHVSDDGEIIEIERQAAIDAATNEQLARAWVEQE